MVDLLVASMLYLSLSLSGIGLGQNTNLTTATTVVDMQRKIDALEREMAALKNEVSRLATDDSAFKGIENVKDRFERYEAETNDAVAKLLRYAPVYIRPVNAFGPNIEWAEQVTSARCGRDQRLVTGIQTRTVPPGRLQLLEFVCVAPLNQ
jgi:hypothetical protein